MSKDSSPEKKKKYDAMKQLCLERKIQNFQNLKKWDQLRSEKLIIHRKIIDQIDEVLEVKLSESNQFTKIVKQFFTDLLSQKNRYLSHQIQNPQAKLQLNTIGRIIYPNSSNILVKLYNNNHTLKHINQTKKILENSLQKIDQFLLETQKQLMDYRTRIELMVLQIQDCNMETLGKCDFLVSIYNQSKQMKAFQSQYDFFIEQEKFLEEADGQILCQRKLGIQIISYFDYVKKREIERLQLLKHLIGQYITSITSSPISSLNSLSTKNSIPQTQQHLTNLQQILNKNTETKYIEQYFSLEQILSRQLIIELARVQSKHQSQINMKYLKGFLQKFQFEEFQNRNLVLKVIRVWLRKEGSGKSVENNDEVKGKSQKQHNSELEPIQMLITVDGFINIYNKIQHSQQEQQLTSSSLNQILKSNQHEPFHHNTNKKSLLYSIKLSPSLVLNRISDIQLQINVKKWGLMSFNQNEQYSIRLIFNTQDQREQFIEFIVQLK